MCISESAKNMLDPRQTNAKLTTYPF